MTLTPYMYLDLPLVNITSGPQFASLVNAAMTKVDSHDHTPNNGKQITTAGLNINADLNFNGFGILETKALNLSVQTSSITSSSTVYVLNGELNFVDGNGNAIQLTSNGAINVSNLAGNISGMNGTTAAVTYNNTAKTFYFTRSSGVAANISVGRSLVIQDSASNTVTVQSPTTVNTSYSITLPTDVASNNYSYLQTDTSGNTSWVRLSLTGLTYVTLSQATGTFTLNQVDPATDIKQNSATTGQRLGWSGSAWVPTDTVTTSAQTSLAAGATITIPSDHRDSTITVAGASTAVTCTLASGVYSGQKATLIGNSSTNTVSMVYSGTLLLNGNITLGAGDTITLSWAGSYWVELNRNN